MVPAMLLLCSERNSGIKGDFGYNTGILIRQKILEAG